MLRRAVVDLRPGTNGGWSYRTSVGSLCADSEGPTAFTEDEFDQVERPRCPADDCGLTLDVRR
jgi:hypothetical protein